MTTQTHAARVGANSNAVATAIGTGFGLAATAWIAYGSPANLADDRALMSIPLAIAAAVAMAWGARAVMARIAGIALVLGAAFAILGWRVATPALADDSLLLALPAALAGTILLGRSLRASGSLIARDSVVAAGLIVAIVYVPILWLAPAALVGLLAVRSGTSLLV